MTSLPIVAIQPRVSSQLQQAASWELVVASIILGCMFVFRCVVYKSGEVTIGLPGKGGLKNFFKNLMNEKAWPHTFLYLILFALVLSATVLFFV